MTARWAVRAATETEPSRPRTGVGENEPLMVHHKKSKPIGLDFLYPLRKQWHLIPRRGYLITRQRASHHRRCIFAFAMMRSNSCRIDDIHAYGVVKYSPAG